MGKRLEVYLTNEEAQKLEELCEVNGCTQSHLVKYAISEMHANGHGSGEHNGHDLRVEIPLQMRLRGLIREAINEVRVERKAREERYRPVREAEEMAEKITREMFKK